MFFRIKKERFKVTSVSRYYENGLSPSTGKYYLTIIFGIKERLFAFDTQEELDSVLDYLDNIVFKVKLI